jgi:hypothetical protein
MIKRIETTRKYWLTIVVRGIRRGSQTATVKQKALPKSHRTVELSPVAVKLAIEFADEMNHNTTCVD